MEKYGARSEWKILEQEVNGKVWSKMKMEKFEARGEWKILEQDQNRKVWSKGKMGMTKQCENGNV